MSYATTRTIYRAEIEIPEDVYRAFGHTSTYDLASSRISSDTQVAASGQDAYASVYEWAEDASSANVEAWAEAWKDYIAYLKGRLRLAP